MGRAKVAVVAITVRTLSLGCRRRRGSGAALMEAMVKGESGADKRRERP
jgi:hypothetical protein